MEGWVEYCVGNGIRSERGTDRTSEDLQTLTTYVKTNTTTHSEWRITTTGDKKANFDEELP